VSDDAGFIRAMAANPTDTLIPLVYADWFDERNDPRGRLLRVWVDLSWRASHAGHGFRQLLDEYRRLLRATDPAWRREFGALRPWVDARLAEELARGYVRYVLPPRLTRLPVTGETLWFTEGPQVSGWVVNLGPGRIHATGCVFVQAEFGWVYPVGLRGVGATVQEFDVELGQGRRF
jgi:uncharacterized protein (TIGR02996 family)